MIYFACFSGIKDMAMGGTKSTPWTGIPNAVQ